MESRGFGGGIPSIFQGRLGSLPPAGPATVRRPHDDRVSRSKARAVPSALDWVTPLRPTFFGGEIPPLDFGNADNHQKSHRQIKAGIAAFPPSGVVVSGDRGKAKEIEALFQGHGYRFNWVWARFAKTPCFL